jgi:type IV pilus assembly protein PilA
MKKIMLKSEDGFTLVELMVVVAIIGILSAIAVPNFKQYQAKSKQSEAKIQLAAVYATEVGANADYDTYATCIADIGFEKPAKGYYIIGFQVNDATSLAQVNTRAGTAICTSTQAQISVAPTTSHLKANNAAALPINTDITDTTPTASVFRAGASGNITSAQTTFDKWTINQDKSLVNSTPVFK